VQARGRAHQHVHAGFGLRSRAVCAEGNGNVPRESLLHNALHPRPISPDGLHVAKDEDDPLSSGRSGRIRPPRGVKRRPAGAGIHPVRVMRPQPFHCAHCAQSRTNASGATFSCIQQPTFHSETHQSLPAETIACVGADAFVRPAERSDACRRRNPPVSVMCPDRFIARNPGRMRPRLHVPLILLLLVLWNQYGELHSMRTTASSS
jgi:hypothetical protein